MLGDSQFWAGLMKFKREFLSLGKFDLGDGSQVRFWEDSWIRPRPLKSLFPALYNTVRKKNAYVRSVLSMTPLNVAFRRSLMGVNLQAWYDVVAMVADVQLTNQRALCVGVTSEWFVFSQIYIQSLIRSTSFTL